MDTSKDSHVLVTGGSGFIGRAVLKLLQRTGSGVILADRAPCSPSCGANAPQGVCDITDAAQLQRVFQKNQIRGIIHLAAILPTAAQRDDVVGMIVRESLAPVLIGLLIGTGAALACAHLTASMLYGVTPTSPASIVAAIVIMVAVSLLASAIPAHRAARVDLMVALRYE